MKRICLEGLCLFMMCGVLLAGQAGGLSPVGKAGDWANTIAGVARGDRIYTVDSAGALHVTDPAAGIGKKIGAGSFANTQFLFAALGSLYSIEQGGNLYVINPADGSKKPVGSPGGWAGTIAGVALNDKIYTVESSGAFYVTDPATGVWTRLGSVSFANVQHLFAAGGKLYSIEKTGNLYVINPVDGAVKGVGKAGDWIGTIAGVGAGGRLLTVEASGALYQTDAATGVWKGIGGPTFGGTQFMFACLDSLFTIEKSGNLYRVDIGAPAPANAAAPAARPAAAPDKGGAAVAGNLTFAFLGKWKGDTTTYEQDPAFKQGAAANPDLAKMMIGMLQGMTMEVTLDGITMTIMGDKVGPVKYSVISATGNVLTIESLEEGKPPTRQDIVFLDAKRIKMAEKGNEAKALFMMKQ
ncbi:MAG: hypothetical protein NTY02_09475 [Acidobacteria bacterium]|nr:hypothetical protein [Acidobacteriota bacterium]